MRMLLVIIIAMFLGMTLVSAARADFQPAPYNTGVTQTRLSTRASARLKYRPAQRRSLFPRMTVEGGYVGSTAVGAPVDGYSSIKSGFMGGANIDFGRGNFVAETGLAYRQLGWSESIANYNLSYTSNYLAVPVYAKYYFMDPSYSTVYGKLGVINSFLLGTTAEFGGQTYNMSAGQSVYSPYDLAGAAAIGGMLRLSPGLFLRLEANYSRGFTSISQNSGAAIYYSAFGGNLGVTFNL